MLHHRKLSVLFSVLVVLVASHALAAPIVVPLSPQDWAAFAGAAPATALIESDYNYNNTFTGHVVSQAFSLSGGGYVYLYQAWNYGPSVLEVFGIAPFFSMDAAGYLTGNEPAGFLTGGYVPLIMTYDTAPAGPVVSFGYYSGFGAHVPPGEHSRVMYMTSPYGPTLGEAYVIDSGVAVASVTVPTPEPATLAFLLMGGAAVMARRTRK